MWSEEQVEAGPREAAESQIWRANMVSSGEGEEGGCYRSRGARGTSY